MNVEYEDTYIFVLLRDIITKASRSDKKREATGVLGLCCDDSHKL